VLVVDDCSEDDTLKVAREHGATVRSAIPGVTPGAYAMDSTYDWILCVRPNESLSDDLEAALFEWKNQEPDETATCYKVSIREENGSQWHERPPETRLINRKMVNWLEELPGGQNCDLKLGGHLLCFREP
jgi:glycosyltransferase involved in cell wall biosynthesis